MSYLLSGSLILSVGRMVGIVKGQVSNYLTLFFLSLLVAVKNCVLDPVSLFRVLDWWRWGSFHKTLVLRQTLRRLTCLTASDSYLICHALPVRNVSKDAHTCLHGSKTSVMF